MRIRCPDCGSYKIHGYFETKTMVELDEDGWRVENIEYERLISATCLSCGREIGEEEYLTSIEN